MCSSDLDLHEGTDLDAGRLHVHDEVGDPPVFGRLGIRAGEADPPPGELGVGGPDLLAGEPPAALDLLGLVVAGYLSWVELGNGIPSCGPFHGCETVAMSSYARIGGIPVAVFGVFLSITLLALAIAWIRSDRDQLLDLHYGLSLVGVIFEIYFISVQAFILHAVCIWCAT